MAKTKNPSKKLKCGLTPIMQQNNAIVCHFCRALAKHMISHVPKIYSLLQNRYQKFSQFMACLALGHGTSEQRKLLA